MTLKSDAKFKKRPTCCLENDMWDLVNFHKSTRKCQNWNFDGILLPKLVKCVTLTFTEELCVMKMKNDTKIEEELTCRFKTYTRNFTNFDPSTQKSKKFVF